MDGLAARVCPVSQREDGKSVEALSPREHEVLQLMARGL